MLNILIIAQQLNIIDPSYAVVEIVSPQYILKDPITAQKTKRVRNKKLTFGVMSDVEIIDALKD